MMKAAAFGRAGCLCAVLVVIGGCGDEAPPLDELPLRDALRADPAVVAALPDDARSRLAARFLAAEGADDGADAVAPPGSPAAAVSLLDRARAERQADALIVGEIAGDGIARAAREDGAASPPAPLPALEGPAATTTAALEARALGGAAGGTLRALLIHAGARRLERVTGWPAGAIAIGDTVYVDAAWLVALAPVATSADGGVAAPSPPASAASRDGVSPLASAVTSTDGGQTTADGGPTVIVPDAGAFDAWPSYPTPPPPPPTTDPTVADACGASADTCASGSDACDSEDDEGSSCNSTSDDSSGCDPPPDDGTNCRVAPGRGRPRRATLLWILAPLAFLVREGSSKGSGRQR